jgi:hypothetical protein
VHRFFAISMLISLALPAAGSAQLPFPFPDRIPEGAIGLEVSVLDPRGDFRPGHALSVGYGASAALGVGPQRAVHIGLGYRSIAHDSYAYSDTLEVRNMLRTFAVTARYTAPLRYARPYIGVSTGAAYFGTETTVERCCDENGERVRELGSIELGQLRPMLATRVGVAVDLWSMPGPHPSTIALDVGVETNYGRRATYQIGGHGELRTTGTGYRVYSLGLRLRTH